MVRPWLLEIYADDRCSDSYAVYADCEDSDAIEDAIVVNDDLWLNLFDSHVGEWADEFEDDEEFEDLIAPHATYIPDDIWKDGVWLDKEYQKWFESLEVVIDERN